MELYFSLLYFFVYGFLGWGAEVGYATVKERHFVNRGFLNGPICPIYGVGVVIVILSLTPYQDNLIFLYIASVILVSLLEGVTGWAMDKIFHNKWWDYSNMPLNIGGYVCLTFSLGWGIGCVIIMKLVQPLIHRALAFLPHTLGIVILVILIATLLTDLYVTASAIFKFNRRLETMEVIAAELHEISDQIGEEIFEKTMMALDKQEESKQKWDEATQKWDEATADFRAKAEEATSDISEELRSHLAELHAGYKDLTKVPSKVNQRLLRAFPKMQARNHAKSFADIKDALEDKFRR